MANGWPEGSIGEVMNDPQTEDSSDFKPTNVKDFTPKMIGEMGDRVVNHVQAATSSQRRAGARFYDRARRDAFHSSRGVTPGFAEDPRRPGRDRSKAARDKIMDEHGSIVPLHERQAGIDRSAHTIAALSPSGGGMKWDAKQSRADKEGSNIMAAHEVGQMSSHAADAMHKVTDLHSASRKAAGALRASSKKTRKGDTTVTDITKPGEGVSKEQHAELRARASGAQEIFRGANERFRSLPDVQKTNLKFTSTDTAATAHRIATGQQEGVSGKVKTQAFAQNIARPRPGLYEADKQGNPQKTAPSQRATVDGRSHNIAVGRDLAWGTTIGLGSPGRYGKFEEAHQEAGARLGMAPHKAQAISWLQHKAAKEATATEGEHKLNRGSRATGGAIRLQPGQFGE